VTGRAALAIGVLAMAAYAQTPGFAFTYDDHAHVEHNGMLDHPGALVSPSRYFDVAFPDQGRPLLVASHVLDRALFGPRPIAGHVQNVLWHVAASLLVMLLVGGVLGRPSAGAAAGAIFALHPIHVEAVANISNREDLLATVFVLASILLGLASLRRRAPWATAGAVVAFALALASKESAIVAPALCALSWWGTREPERPPRRRVAVLAVGFAVVAVLWGVFQIRLGLPSLVPAGGGAGLRRAAVVAAPVAVLAGAASGDRGPDDERPAPRAIFGDVRAYHALSILPFYALRLVVPWPLTAEYDFAPFQRPWALAAGAIALAVLVLLAVRSRRRRPELTLAIGWFAVACLPVAVPSWLLNPVAERYLYLPSVAVGGLGGVALAEWIPEPVRRVVTLALLGVLAVATTVRTAVWHDDVALFSDAVQKAPRSPRAWCNLGLAELRRGRREPARMALERTLAIDPDWTAARAALGRIAVHDGRLDEAERQWRAALDAPTLAGEVALRDTILRSLSRLLVERGRAEDALGVLDAEAQQRPSDAPTELLRGRVFVILGRREEAIAALERAGRLGDRSEERRSLLARARELR
jgi:tetratricopeptide (TPR) repeat protein